MHNRFDEEFHQSLAEEMQSDLLQEIRTVSAFKYYCLNRTPSKEINSLCDQISSYQPNIEEIEDYEAFKNMHVDFVARINKLRISILSASNENEALERQKNFKTFNLLMYFKASRSTYVAADENQRPYIALKNNIRKAMSAYLAEQLRTLKKNELRSLLTQMQHVEDIFDKHDQNLNPNIIHMRGEIENKIKPFGNPLKQTIAEQNQKINFPEKHPYFEKILTLTEKHPHLHRALILAAITLAFVALTASIAVGVGVPIFAAALTTVGLTASCGYLTGAFAFGVGLALIGSCVAAITIMAVNRIFDHSKALINAKFIRYHAEKITEPKYAAKKEHNSQTNQTNLTSQVTPTAPIKSKLKRNNATLSCRGFAQFVGSLFCCGRRTNVKDPVPCSNPDSTSSENSINRSQIDSKCCLAKEHW